MSRVIKFKAKKVTDGEWIYGSLVVTPTSKYYIVYYEEDWGVRIDNQVNPDTVCQLLAIEDGIEIYEGDIEEGVENEHHHNAKYKILYSIDGFRPVFQEWDFQENKWGEKQTLGNLISVVPSGNIHDEK